MVIITDKGNIFSCVVDKDDSGVLWVRSQDVVSIRHLAKWLAKAYGPDDKRKFPIIKTVDRDYEFRIKLTRSEWADYLVGCVREATATNVKNQVGKVRGYRSPIMHVLEEIFYYMAGQRADGTKPAFMRGYKAG